MVPAVGSNRHRLTDRLAVESGTAAQLDRRDPGDTLDLGDKLSGQVRSEMLSTRLGDLHNRLWAEARRSVILVLQGMDASGKDGTIRRVLSGLNPQGCAVTNFKVPTELQLAHDYLWRVHHDAPARGLLGVWNRSHYEDVIAARMLGVIGSEHAARRFRHVREFERMLHDEGTSMVKVFLHISKEEQRSRLQARIDDPAKNWKFQKADLEARRHWDDYQAFCEEAITETSTDWAPWYVVPADRKWVRDVAVAELLIRVLEDLDPQIPDPEPGLEGIVVE
jgi:PPK2 family polyphosphate:nucleotide phosphotransferase